VSLSETFGVSLWFGFILGEFVRSLEILLDTNLRRYMARARYPERLWQQEVNRMERIDEAEKWNTKQLLIDR
jgi:hypothetical protein